MFSYYGYSQTLCIKCWVSEIKFHFFAMDYEICKWYSCGCWVNSNLGIPKVATLTLPTQNPKTYRAASLRGQTQFWHHCDFRSSKFWCTSHFTLSLELWDVFGLWFTYEMIPHNITSVKLGKEAHHQNLLKLKAIGLTMSDEKFWNFFSLSAIWFIKKCSRWQDRLTIQL
jgi:hypothetical protein